MKGVIVKTTTKDGKSAIVTTKFNHALLSIARNINEANVLFSLIDAISENAAKINAYEPSQIIFSHSQKIYARYLIIVLCRIFDNSNEPTNVNIFNLIKQSFLELSNHRDIYWSNLDVLSNLGINDKVILRLKESKSVNDLIHQISMTKENYNNILEQLHNIRNRVIGHSQHIQTISQQDATINIDDSTKKLIEFAENLYSCIEPLTGISGLTPIIKNSNHKNALKNLVHKINN